MKVINYIDNKRKNWKLDERSYETTKLRNDGWHHFLLNNEKDITDDYR